MLGVFEFDENCQENTLMIFIGGEEDGCEFIQVPSPRDLVMAEFYFCANDWASPRVPAPDDGWLTVIGLCQGFLPQFDPLSCDLEGHRSEFCAENAFNPVNRLVRRGVDLSKQSLEPPPDSLATDAESPLNLFSIVPTEHKPFDAILLQVDPEISIFDQHF